jgi:hypothetical protein
MGVLNTLEWKAVESSVFTSSAYRPEVRQLYLRFRDGDIYRYFDCTVEMYEAFLAAESKGRYFARHIRNRFRYEQVRYGQRRSGGPVAGQGRRGRISAAPLPTQPA